MGDEEFFDDDDGFVPRVEYDGYDLFAALQQCVVGTIEAVCSCKVDAK